MVFFSVLIFISLPFSLQAQELRPFVSDGCTLSPSGTLKEPNKWISCCVEHDLRYWGGGSREDKTIADLQLRNCLEKKANIITAFIFWQGVRLGNLSPWKLPSKQWGNAWYEDAGYWPLTIKQKEQIITELQTTHISDHLKMIYIDELHNRRPAVK